VVKGAVLLIPLSSLLAKAALVVGVGSGVNCPGLYKLTGSGKVCQAHPEYQDILYLGENSRKSCKVPYTRINAGDSKWCVMYVGQ